ncbi:MAG: LysR family transcriptional regulator [Cellvibrio sp.]
MQDLNDLYYFVQVVEHRGFAPASRALSIPRSKLSRRIADLESRLGVRLLQRSTRHFHVTELGQRYYEHCKAMLIEADAAQAVIDGTQSEPSGLIRLSCPITLLNAHVAQMLTRFMLVYPKVRIDLEATNRRVDVLAEGLDLAIRVRPPPLEDSELILRVLSDRGKIIVASPALFSGDIPTTPEALMAYPAMAVGNMHERHTWTLINRQNVSCDLAYTPRYATTDMLALKDAAIAGLGIVQLPLLTVRDALARGELIQLLPEWSLPREIIHLVYPSRRGLLPSVRRLIDHLAECFAAFDED